MAHLYKRGLQDYAQKRNIPFPTYATETQGPPHALLFKSQVTIDGNTYVGPHFSSTLKQAEHRAAKVAFLALSADAPQEDHCFHKSLLQELAQKKGLVLPVYATNKTGPPHMPCFVSTVEISGGSYVGEEAQKKKQAEMNAAKVAYIALTEGGPRTSKTAVYNNVATSSSNHSNPQTVMSQKAEPVIRKMEKTTINAVGTSVPNNPEKTKGGPEANNLTAIPNIVGTRVSSSSSLQTVIIPEKEPTVDKSVTYSIPNEPEKANGYLELKDMQDAREKGTITLPRVTIHQPHPENTLNVVELSKPVIIHDTCLHKSLLHELAQKKDLVLPVYTTNKSGAPHMPRFVSTVEISGGSYVGEEARTKKQAEINAAKVAYIALTEGGPTTSTTSVTSNSVAASISNHSNLQMVMPEKNEPTSTIKMETTTTNGVDISVPNDPEKERGGPRANNVTAVPNIAGTTVSGSSSSQAVILPKNEPTVNSSINYSNPDDLEKKEGSGSNGKTIKPFVKEAAARTQPTRILIRPHVDGMTFDGPIQVSDNEWVAMEVPLNAGM